MARRARAAACLLSIALLALAGCAARVIAESDEGGVHGTLLESAAIAVRESPR